MKRLALAALLASASAGAVDLGQARDLLNQRKAAEAYTLLAADENEKGGEVEFDYLLGIAALDSGRPAEAVTAFERLLAVNPSHHGARMDLARAYYALGADGLAQREFAHLQTLNPPPQARGAIEQYLRAIESRKQGSQPKARGFLEMALGYDDNLTTVTSDFEGGVRDTYGIPGVQPSSGNATSRKDGVYTLSGGWSYRHPSDAWLFDVDLGAVYKGYFDNDAYNSATLSAGAGAGWRTGQHFLRAGLIGLGSWQETEQMSSDTVPQPVTNDRTMIGISGQWRYDVNRDHQLSLQLQYNQMRFADVPVNDIDQAILTGGWAMGLGKTGLLFTSVFVGEDLAVNNLPNGRDYSRTNVGLRLNSQWQATAAVGLYALLGVSQRLDHDEASRGGVAGKGRDVAVDATLGASLALKGPWSVRAQYTHSRNDSNFDLYDYERNELSATLRYDFR